MKKLFSLAIVVVMVFAFANVSFADADYTVTMELTDTNGDVIEDAKEIAVDEDFFVNLYISEIPKDLRGATIKVSYDESLVKVSDFSSDYVWSDQKISKRDYWGVGCKAYEDGVYISYVGDPVNTGSYLFDEELPLVTICFTKVANAGAADIKTEQFNLTDKGLVNYTAANAPVLNVALGEEEEDKGYEDLSAEVVVATGNTVGTDLTDCQVGTGFYAKFTVPAALDSMKWSAKIGGVRKFSTEAIDLKPYDGIEVGADVVLYGAFTNGEHSENGFTAKKETETVTDAGIIVKSGETFYASADAFTE